MIKHCPALAIGSLCCLLLAVPMSACDECAWVLWAETTDTGRVRHPQSVLNAYTGQAACEVAIRDQLAALASLHAQMKASNPVKAASQTVVGSGSSMTVITQSGNTWEKVDYLCLPDTVDPRGPKGK